MIAHAALVESPLDVSEHLAAVAHPGAGATALFVGTVRDHDPAVTGQVVQLDYSAHPDADAILHSIAERYDTADLRIAVSHRVGSLGVGDVAIVCAVSSAHRTDAFAVNRELVEAIKAELPVWKKQFEADGSASWVGVEGITS